MKPHGSSGFSRRDFLLIAGSGVVGAIGWENLKPKPSLIVTPSTPVIQLQTQTLNNIITVDSSGRETNRRTVQVQYFVEDKISLPSGAKQIEMALIPAGKFDMGTSAQERQIVLENALKFGGSRKDVEKRLDISAPIKSINFAQSFYVSRYAVTQAQWFEVMGGLYDYWTNLDGVSRRFRELYNNFKGDNRPMVMVSWDDAKAYCSELSKRTGRTYRLLTEAEWEYSCRAKTTTPFHFGETITTELARYDGRSPYYANAVKGVYHTGTTDVGNFPPNEWGLYDMHGNVWEWCEDVWHENYNGIPQCGSAWLSGGDQERRVYRGGSYYAGAGGCRSAQRVSVVTYGRADFIGFRVATSVLL